jgi:hypothetical protein
MSTQPVAASIKEIKAAFPKMKDSFFVKCLEKELPLASVAGAAAEELMAENQELMAKVAAMEEEMTSLKAKAMEDEEVKPDAMEGEEEVTEEETAKATAKVGAKPVARAKSSATKDATTRWNEAVDAALATAKTRFKAVAIANRKHPGLREQMLAEANAR